MSTPTAPSSGNPPSKESSVPPAVIPALPVLELSELSSLVTAGLQEIKTDIGSVKSEVAALKGVVDRPKRDWWKDYVVPLLTIVAAVCGALLSAKCTADWTMANARSTTARAEIAKADVQNYLNASRWIVEINNGLESLILTGKPDPKSEHSANELSKLVDANAFAEATDAIKQFTIYVYESETTLRNEPTRPWKGTDQIKKEAKERLNEALSALASWNQRGSPY